MPFANDFCKHMSDYLNIAGLELFTFLTTRGCISHLADCVQVGDGGSTQEASARDFLAKINESLPRRINR